MGRMKDKENSTVSVSPHLLVSLSLFHRLLHLTTSLRWIVVPAYLILTLLGTFFLGGFLGLEIFPQVDAGQFQFRLRAPEGTRIEQTEEITREALAFIGKEVGPENVAITLGYVGVVPSSYPSIASSCGWAGPMRP